MSSLSVAGGLAAEGAWAGRHAVGSSSELGRAGSSESGLCCRASTGMVTNSWELCRTTLATGWPLTSLTPVTIPCMVASC